MQLPKQLKTFKKVAGIQLHRVDNARVVYYYTILEKKGDSINTLDAGKALDINELASKIDKDIPIALTLSGKGIFHKKVGYLPEQPEEILHAALPNAVPEDFIYQAFHTENTNWISIFRIEAVKEHLQLLLEKEWTVIQFELGIFGVATILPLLENSSENIQTAYHKIIKQNDNLTDILLQENQETAEEYLLGTENIKGEHLPSFATAFQVFVGQKAQVYNVDNIQKAKEGYFFQKLIKTTGWAILGSIFALLLVNFLAFSWLNKSTQSQQLELNYHQKQLAELNQLKKRYKEQEAFLKQNNVLKPSKISFYADEIAASLPKELELTELAIFPDQASRREQRDNVFRFAQNTIHIKGLTKRPTKLNAWINTLENMEWVDQVKVLPYAEKAGGVGEFFLEVIVLGE